jgi:PAS domain S-box-containing protein
MAEDQSRPSTPPPYLSPEARTARAVAEGRNGEDALRTAVAREIREAVQAAVKDAEEIEKLRQSEKHYRVFAEQSSDIFWIMGLDMKFSYVSPSVERMRGFSPEEVLTQRMDEIFTPSSVAVIAGNLQSGLSDEAAGLVEPHLWRVMELEQICKDGSTLWTEAAATWLKNEQGQVIGVLGVTRNVDARKRAEAALRRAHEELEQRVVERTAELRQALDELKKRNVELGVSEARYRTLVETSPDAILLVNTERRILVANRQAATLLGFPDPEALQGLPIAELLVPADRSRAGDNYQAALQKGVLRNIEYQFLRKDGSTFPAEMSVAVVKNERGDLIAFQSIAHDITERKQAEERERRHQEELRQADKLMALGGLVSGVAHEINNPNHVISLNIATFQSLIPELLARLDKHAEQNGDFQVGRLPWVQVREETPRLLEDVRMASNRIKRIVTDLKEYARPDSVEQPAPFNLNAAVEDAVSLMRSVLKKATDRFELQLDPQLPDLIGRKRRVEQVVINLLQNACQALSANRQAVRVRTYRMEKPLRVAVEVRDEGGGIAPEHLSRLTDPFFTTKREKGGTGLGLAVSLGIARDHGGELEFQSLQGQGTTARLVLPIPMDNPRESP